MRDGENQNQDPRCQTYHISHINIHIVKTNNDKRDKLLHTTVTAEGLYLSCTNLSLQLSNIAGLVAMATGKPILESNQDTLISLVRGSLVSSVGNKNKQ